MPITTYTHTLSLFSHSQILENSSPRGGKIRTQSAVIAGIFAGGTCAIELDSTYTTDIVLWHVPSPRGHRVPFVYSDFHGELA